MVKQKENVLWDVASTIHREMRANLGNVADNNRSNFQPSSKSPWFSVRMERVSRFRRALPIRRLLVFLQGSCPASNSNDPMCFQVYRQRQNASEAYKKVEWGEYNLTITNCQWQSPFVPEFVFPGPQLIRHFSVSSHEGQVHFNLGAQDFDKRSWVTDWSANYASLHMFISENAYAAPFSHSLILEVALLNICYKEKEPKALN